MKIWNEGVIQYSWVNTKSVEDPPVKTTCHQGSAGDGGAAAEAVRRLEGAAPPGHLVLLHREHEVVRLILVGEVVAVHHTGVASLTSWPPLVRAAGCCSSAVTPLTSRTLTSSGSDTPTPPVLCNTTSSTQHRRAISWIWFRQYMNCLRDLDTANHDEGDL